MGLLSHRSRPCKICSNCGTKHYYSYETFCKKCGLLLPEPVQVPDVPDSPGFADLKKKLGWEENEAPPAHAKCGKRQLVEKFLLVGFLSGVAGFFIGFLYFAHFVHTSQVDERPPDAAVSLNINKPENATITPIINPPKAAKAKTNAQAVLSPPARDSENRDKPLNNEGVQPSGEAPEGPADGGSQDGGNIIRDPLGADRR